MAARAAFAENRQERFLLPDASLWGGRAMTQDKLLLTAMIAFTSVVSGLLTYLALTF